MSRKNRPLHKRIRRRDRILRGRQKGKNRAFGEWKPKEIMRIAENVPEYMWKHIQVVKDGKITVEELYQYLRDIGEE